MVCNKCKIIFYPEKVEWGCGNCKRKFLCDKMIILESAIEKEKNYERELGLKANTNYGFFFEKKYQKSKADKKEKYMTDKKSNRYLNEGIKKIKSQKIEFKPKKKIIVERNKNNIDLDIKKNLGSCLETLDMKNNNFKNPLEKIRQKFDITKSENLANISYQNPILTKKFYY